MPQYCYLKNSFNCRRKEETLKMRILRSIVFLIVLSVGTSTAAPSPVITAVTAPVIHGEGPFWDAAGESLYFVDISGKTVNCLKTKTGQLFQFVMDGPVSFVMGVRGSPGCLLIGQDRDLMYLRWYGVANATLAAKSSVPNSRGCAAVTGRAVVIASVDRGEGKERNRFNDAKADGSGRLWAGTMGHESADGVITPKNGGTLYSLEPTSQVPRPRVTDVGISNGIAWNADNTVMYFIDTPTRTVDAFDYNTTVGGSIANRRTIFNMAAHGNLKGYPDGMTIDNNGHLWIALYKGSAVIKVDPAKGTLLQTLAMPCDYVTSVAFGGETLDVLYVTTSRRDLTSKQRSEQPSAGAVFAVRGLGVRGAVGDKKVKRSSVFAS